ncbi:hypothetical protein Mapa_004223 [Marchantia paleacea]|nr:hypothetical protein Mapa_004223 [Marchantia paleacea]
MREKGSVPVMNLSRSIPCSNSAELAGVGQRCTKATVTALDTTICHLRRKLQFTSSGMFPCQGQVKVFKFKTHSVTVPSFRLLRLTR